MFRRTTLPGALAVAALAAACSEPAGPYRRSLDAPLFQDVGPTAGISLDVHNGSLNEHGRRLVKGFDPRNPHLGDAIIATFYWLGETYIIDSVTDVLNDANATPVGNKYQLVDYVTAGGYSMATYVATNVQNFDDAGTDRILVVRADLADSVDGGVTISAWTGVNAVAAYALGAARSGAGVGSGIITVGPGSIPIGAGALAYAVTMSNGIVGRDPPPGFRFIDTGSDNLMVNEIDYAVPTAIGTVDPQWTWYFAENTQNTWLATVLALNPPLHLAFTVQPSTTLPLVRIQPAVQVAVLDALGERVTSFNGPLTIAIGRNGGLLVPGALSGTKTVTVVNGVATFSDLSIDQPGNGYTLVVSAASVFGAESAPFNIGAF
jgi:hypothetical protein